MSVGGNVSERCPDCGGFGHCRSCNGLGRCNKCHGEKLTREPGLFGDYHVCDACNGTGKCSLCHGTGKCPGCGGTGVAAYICKNCKMVLRYTDRFCPNCGSPRTAG